MRIRNILLFVLALAVAALAVKLALDRTRGAAGTGPAPTVRVARNRVAVPDFTVTDLDGRTFTLSSLKGKVVLVNFWATWCGPCRAEIPGLIELQDKYRNHLVILGIATDEPSVDQVRAFAKQNRMNYPIVMESDETRRAFPPVAALPTTFVLDPEGRQVQKHVGLVDLRIYEDAARALAGLVDATIEEVDESGAALPPGAAATEVPGVDLSGFSEDKKKAILEKLNTDKCTCGCGLTLAQCRINDPSCTVSPPLVQAIVKSAQE